MIIADVEPALQKGRRAEQDQDDASRNAMIPAIIDFLFKNRIHLCLHYPMQWLQGYPGRRDARQCRGIETGARQDRFFL